MENEGQLEALFARQPYRTCEEAFKWVTYEITIPLVRIAGSDAPPDVRLAQIDRLIAEWDFEAEEPST